MEQEQPTDPLEEVREKIARLYSECAGVDFDTLPEKYKERNRIIATNVFSITLKRGGGGKCPVCNGKGKTFYASDRIPLQDCSTCNGTGKLREQTASISDIIKEWKDGK